MNTFLQWLSQPWPWYVAGPMIGLTVPALLLLGNKSFGISSSLRHICAACVPAGIPFFSYNWKKEIWNLLFVLGVGIGGFLVGFGTRYAGGCTSGHAIMGISNLQWPSLVATVFFMLGGFLMTNVLLEPLMKWVGF